MAVANDGTVPVFYYRRGSGDGANRWVFWFKGGFACFDPESCDGREAGLISSNAWNRSDVVGTGILSREIDDNPDFYNWNHVQMIYLSSDAWSGTREDVDPATGFYFSGSFIVDAIIDTLRDDTWIGYPALGDATHVLLTGSSAGAAGLRNNVDRIANMLSWANVRAVSDAALTYQVNPDTVDTAAGISEKTWATWAPYPDESCVVAHSDDPAWCMEGVNLLEGHHISTPMFVRHDLVDPVALDGLGLDRQNPGQRPLIQEYASKIANLLSQQSGAYGTRAGMHVMLESPTFNRYEVNGLTFAEVLGNWYFERDGPVNIIEST